MLIWSCRGQLGNGPINGCFLMLIKCRITGEQTLTRGLELEQANSRRYKWNLFKRYLHNAAEKQTLVLHIQPALGANSCKDESIELLWSNLIRNNQYLSVWTSKIKYLCTIYIYIALDHIDFLQYAILGIWFHRSWAERQTSRIKQKKNIINKTSFSRQGRRMWFVLYLVVF